MCEYSNVVAAWLIRSLSLTALDPLYPQRQVVRRETCIKHAHFHQYLTFTLDHSPHTLHHKSLQQLQSTCLPTLNSTARPSSTRPSRSRTNTSSSTATRALPPSRLRSTLASHVQHKSITLIIPQVRQEVRQHHFFLHGRHL